MHSSKHYRSLNCLVLLFCLSADSCVPDWVNQRVTLKPADSGFQIDFPGKPELAVRTIKSGALWFEVWDYEYEDKNSKVVYGISHFDYPDSLRLNMTEGQIYEESSRRVADGIGGKIIRSEEIQIQNWKGIEFKVQLGGDMRYIGRMFIVGGRLFQIIVVGSHRYLLTKAVGSYLDSFGISESAIIDSGWMRTTSHDGGFSIDMPGRPTRERLPVPTVMGGLELTSWLLETPDGGTTYGVGYFDNPSVEGEVGSSDVLLAGARDGALKELGAIKVDEEETTLGEVPGLKVDVKIPAEEATGTVVFYLRGSRLFQLVNIRLQRVGETSMADERFFGSFKIHEDQL